MACFALTDLGLGFTLRWRPVRTSWHSCPVIVLEHSFLAGGVYIPLKTDGRSEIFWRVSSRSFLKPVVFLLTHEHSWMANMRWANLHPVMCQ